jgi:hypothetical protein
MAGPCPAIGRVLGLRADNVRTSSVSIAFPRVPFSYVLIIERELFEKAGDARRRATQVTGL